MQKETQYQMETV